MAEWVWNLYRAVRVLVLFVAAVLRALLAAVILAEDLWIHARGRLLLQLAVYRERREVTRAAAPVATWPADSAAEGMVPARVVTLDELRRARAARGEPA